MFQHFSRSTRLPISKFRTRVCSFSYHVANVRIMQQLSGFKTNTRHPEGERHVTTGGFFNAPNQFSISLIIVPLGCFIVCMMMRMHIPPPAPTSHRFSPRTRFSHPPHRGNTKTFCKCTDQKRHSLHAGL